MQIPATSFSAYLPADRRIAINLGQDLPDRTQGAVLFADISGFVPLTSALARELGPQRGAEELTEQLNRVYGELISRIHDYHGSIVSFSGDAITCWFDDRPVDHPVEIEEGSLRAVACAFAIQDAMTQFQSVLLPGGTTTSLHIKVAITAGDVRRFAIGLPEIQRIDVLAGKLLDCVAAAEHLAGRDEVIVGEEIVDHLGSYLKVQEWRDDGGGGRFAMISNPEKIAPKAPWVEIPYLPAEAARE